MLHRLLAKYFLDNGDKFFYDKTYIVDHIDNNKLNNKIENLQWINRKQNSIKSLGKSIIKLDPKTNECIKVYNSITEITEELNKPGGRANIIV